MSTIWKFRSPNREARTEDEVLVTSLTLPITARVTEVLLSDEALTVWAVVPEQDAPQEKRDFVVVPTGANYDATGLRFINVAHLASEYHEHGYVFHIFERTT